MALTDTMRKKVFRRSGDIVTRKIVGETLLVPVKGDIANLQRIYVLEGSGVFIWEMVDGAKKVGAIGEELVDAFEVSKEEAEHDLGEFLGNLVENELIEEVFER